MKRYNHIPFVKRIIKKAMPEKEKTRDLWDKLQISAPLFSSFLIGIAGIYFTNSYNTRQQVQTKIQQAAQIKLDSLRLQTQNVEALAKIQAAQLEAMTKLAPYLSSKDKLKRNVGYLILHSVDSVSRILKNNMQLSTIPNRLDTVDDKRMPANDDISVYGVALRKIRKYVEDATNPTLTFSERVGAYDSVVRVALDKTKAAVVRNAATVAVTEIRRSPNSPLLGIGFTLEEFRKYVDTISLNNWRPSYIVLHSTYTPSLKTLPNGFDESTILGFVKFFTEKQNWRGAPHLLVDDHKIWILNPLTRSGIHSPSWNINSIGVSLLGNYTIEKTDSGRGQAVLNNAIAAVAVLGKKFGISADSLKMHYEDKKVRTACPGNNIKKSEVIAKTKLTGV